MRGAPRWPGLRSCPATLSRSPAPGLPARSAVSNEGGSAPAVTRPRSGRLSQVASHSDGPVGHRRGRSGRLAEAGAPGQKYPGAAGKPAGAAWPTAVARTRLSEPTRNGAGAPPAGAPPAGALQDSRPQGSRTRRPRVAGGPFGGSRANERWGAGQAARREQHQAPGTRMRASRQLPLCQLRPARNRDLSSAETAPMTPGTRGGQAG
jgi:hypothetical protein